MTDLIGDEQGVSTFVKQLALPVALFVAGFGLGALLL